MNKLRTTVILVSLLVLAGTTYLVKKGDTLWDLSAEFLTDPFAWPDLWQKNSHIRDPHWIYPGDSLCMPGQDQECQPLPKDTSLQTAPQRKTPCAPGQTTGDTVIQGIRYNCNPVGDREADFQNQLGSLKGRGKKESLARADSTIYIYNQRQAPRILNAYYQHLSPRFLPLEDYKKEAGWFNVTSGEKKAPQLHSLEHELQIGYGATNSPGIKIGDLTEIWLAEKQELKSVKDKKAENYVLLRLAAIARISAVGDTVSRATIVQNFRQLNLQNAKARPQQHPVILEVSGFRPVQESRVAEMGTIRLSMDAGLVIGQYSYVMVDKGTTAGFATGSGVAFWEEDLSDPGLPPRLLGKGLVTRAGKNESAVLVRELHSHIRRLSEGHKVSLTHLPILK